MRIQPGHFNRLGAQSVALSQVPQMIGKPASFVQKAVERGDLHTETVSGCKVVVLGELFRFVGEGGKHEHSE